MVQSASKTMTPTGRASSAWTSASGPSRRTASLTTASGTMASATSARRSHGSERAEHYAGTLSARRAARTVTAGPGRRSRHQERAVFLMGVGLRVVEPAAALGEVPEADRLPGRQGHRDAPGAVAAL